jgi:SAM-dependent methyltransferase
MDAATQNQLKGGFDQAADSYASSRPGYPDAAADWLVGMRAHDVLDLGAGSGSLTAQLRRRAPRVVAADPSRNLLTQLRAATADIPAVQASAEALPFIDRSFDVVTVATAFHWFDPVDALPEIARVLRPDGHLALVWNTRVAASPISRDLGALLRSARPSTLQGDWGAGSVRVLDDSRYFAAPSHAAFEHAQTLDREALVRLAASRSYVIALDPPARTTLLEQVAALFDAHVGNSGTVSLPYRVDCFRSSLRP